MFCPWVKNKKIIRPVSVGISPTRDTVPSTTSATSPTDSNNSDIKSTHSRHRCRLQSPLSPSTKPNSAKYPSFHPVFHERILQKWYKLSIRTRIPGSPRYGYRLQRTYQPRLRPGRTIFVVHLQKSITGFPWWTGQTSSDQKRNGTCSDWWPALGQWDHKWASQQQQSHLKAEGAMPDDTVQCLLPAQNKFRAVLISPVLI